MDGLSKMVPKMGAASEKHARHLTSPDDQFAASLQAKFNAVWQEESVEAARVDVAKPSHLNVIAAFAGKLPTCAAKGQPIFWVYLTGLFRTFAAPNHLKNLRDFLDRSSSCWMVVLFTMDVVDSIGVGGVARLQRTHIMKLPAGPAGVVNAIRSAALSLDDRLAYAVVERSRDTSKFSLDPNTCILQNWAAIAELGRELASHHELATSSRDVIFVGRPDLLYSKAVNFTSMHSLFQAAPTPLVLLTRENERGGKAENTASSFDPMIAAWFASRGALDAMCPTGAHCGGIASGSIQELTEISCGYPYSKLLLLTPGISAFFIPMNWPLCFQRVYTTEPEFVTNGPQFTSDAYKLTTVGDAVDVTAKLWCARHGDRKQPMLGCTKEAPSTVATPWGDSTLVRMCSHPNAARPCLLGQDNRAGEFPYHQYYVCNSAVTDHATVVRGLHNENEKAEKHLSMAIAATNKRGHG
jgi:hypothetical protein